MIKVAFAGYYELIDGKRIEVCQAYEKNLNSFKPRLPMGCKRPVNEKMTDFGKPKWVSPSDGMAPNNVSLYEIYNQMSDLLWERDVNPVQHFTITKWPEWQGTLAQMEKAHKSYKNSREAEFIFRPYIAKFDIDNDNNKEPVYFEQSCGGATGSLLAILSSDYREIDRKKTELVMSHPPFKAKGRKVFRPMFDGEKKTIFLEKYGYTPIENAIHNIYYDVFFYKGKTYFDQWWLRHPSFKDQSDMKLGRLRVYKASPTGTEQICTLRFIFEG